MSKYTPPNQLPVKKTISDTARVDKPSEVTEEKPTISPVTALVKPRPSNKVEVMKASIDAFFEAVSGATRRVYTEEEYSDIQCNMMDNISSSLMLNYNDYVLFMEHFIGLIIDNPKTFSASNRLKLAEYISKNKRHARQDYKQRYFNYIEAVVVLSNNMAQRHRVGNMVDIPTLTKGLHPTAVKNITTYFTSAYS